MIVKVTSLIIACFKQIHRVDLVSRVLFISLDQKLDKQKYYSHSCTERQQHTVVEKQISNLLNIYTEESIKTWV